MGCGSSVPVATGKHEEKSKPGTAPTCEGTRADARDAQIESSKATHFMYTCTLCSPHVLAAPASKPHAGPAQVNIHASAQHSQAPALTPPARKTSHALIVGIDYPGSAIALHGCAADAKRFSDVRSDMSHNVPCVCACMMAHSLSCAASLWEYDYMTMHCSPLVCTQSC